MRTTFYSQNFIGWPPVAVCEVADSDSEYWHEQAEEALWNLKKALGSAQYSDWMTIVWPEIRRNTWASITTTVKAALADHAAGKDVVGNAHSYVQNTSNVR